MRTLTLAVLAFALVQPAVHADDPEPKKTKLTKEDIEKADKAVKKLLEEKKAGTVQLARIEDKALEASLPGYVFFTLTFRQFPVARAIPEGFKAANLVAVGADAKPKVLTAAKELQSFVKENLPARKTEAELKNAARAYVRLSQELHQDGFYRFKLEDDSTKVKGSESASARVSVTQGGNGTLEATLKFGREGKLDGVEESVKIRPGPRPICQATKLLDDDPLVRAMAEQALLCMGRAAKDYLDEQKAKASPALKRAIERVWGKIVAQDE